MDLDDQSLQGQKQDEEGEMGQGQDEENDERLVLTPWDVENLMKDIAGGGTEQKGQEPTKDFSEQVSEKLEEYQQQLDVDSALQANLAQKMFSQQQQLTITIQPTHGETQTPPDTQVGEEEKQLEEEQSQEVGRVTTQVNTKGGSTEEGTPQWLTFTFNKKKKVVLPKLSL